MRGVPLDTFRVVQLPGRESVQRGEDIRESLVSYGNVHG